MNIISASRRTDIPAYYSQWLMSVVRQGQVSYVHPYSRKELMISLVPEDVIALVLWSKNFSPLLAYLEELGANYHLIFHFTITGLPVVFEPRSPEPRNAVEIFKQISSQFSSRNIIWRYDPIIMTQSLNKQYHIDKFSYLAEELAGYTEKCYISLVQPYAKVKNGLAQCGYIEPEVADIIELVRHLNHIASTYGISLYSCCAPILHASGIPKAHCVDRQLIESITGKQFPHVRQRPTRQGCGCWASVDIGTYGTCKNGCIYCYAK